MATHKHSSATKSIWPWNSPWKNSNFTLVNTWSSQESAWFIRFVPLRKRIEPIRVLFWVSCKRKAASKAGWEPAFLPKQPLGSRRKTSENWEFSLMAGRGCEGKIKQAYLDRLKLVQSLFYICVAIDRANRFCIDLCPISNVCLMMVADFTQATELKKGCLIAVAIKLRWNWTWKNVNRVYIHSSPIFPQVTIYFF